MIWGQYGDSRNLCSIRSDYLFIRLSSTLRCKKIICDIKTYRVGYASRVCALPHTTWWSTQDNHIPRGRHVTGMRWTWRWLEKYHFLSASSAPVISGNRDHWPSWSVTGSLSSYPPVCHYPDLDPSCQTQMALLLQLGHRSAGKFFKNFLVYLSGWYCSFWWQKCFLLFFFFFQSHFVKNFHLWEETKILRFYTIGEFCHVDCFSDPHNVKRLYAWLIPIHGHLTYVLIQDIFMCSARKLFLCLSLSLSALTAVSLFRRVSLLLNLSFFEGSCNKCKTIFASIFVLPASQNGFFRSC